MLRKEVGVKMISRSIVIFLSVFAICLIFTGQAGADVGLLDLIDRPATQSAAQPALEIYTGERPMTLHWSAIITGREIMLPAPDLAVAMEAGFEYFPGNGKVEFSKEFKSITLKVSPEQGDGAFRMPDGVIYVPLTPVVSGLGGAVYRSGNSGKVNILFTKKQYDKSVPYYSAVNAMEDMLPPGSQLILPLNKSADEKDDGEKGSVRAEAAAQGDLDGDGLTEQILCYQSPSGSAGIIVYREKEGIYQKLWQTGGNGIIRDLIVSELNGGGSELLLGRQDGDYFGSALQVYSWQEGSPRLVFVNSYNRIETGDFNGDGKNEFSLWSEDVEGAYDVNVYHWDGEGFTLYGAYPAYFKKVTQYYQEQLKKQPGNKAFIYYLADACLRAGDTGTALELSTRGAGMVYGYPPEQYFQRLRGEALLQTGKYREAAVAYQKALSSAAEHSLWPGAGYSLALCYKNMGNDQLAVMAITLALNQGNDWAVFNEALETLTAWQAGVR